MLTVAVYDVMLCVILKTIGLSYLPYYREENHWALGHSKELRFSYWTQDSSKMKLIKFLFK
jgi:hypothetical protein